MADKNEKVQLNSLEIKKIPLNPKYFLFEKDFQ